ncbi:MAG: site-specific integrase [Chromatiales bacterium]|nr:site-specific integrase [Chromatiales bacterium]
MPRPTKGPRLYRRADRGYYVIRDGDRFVRTGTRDSGEAEAALARYLAEKGRQSGPRAPHQMTVATALDIYGRERAPAVRAPERIGYAIAALLPVLGSLPVGSITGEVCRRYAKTRGKAPGTVRKELGVLAAALNHCHAEGYLTSAPKVRLPAKPAPRDRWLTRDEAARLIRAAYRNPKARHLARFILVALYTGTRSEAILRLRFMPHTGGGHVDTEAGRIYRRGARQTETKKRQPPIPIPRKLLAHLRRWERNGAQYVVDVDGQRVGSVKTAWRTALAEADIEHCTRHDLRHTAITWAMQRGIDKWTAAGYFGVTLDVLEGTYGHHHPDFLQGAVEAMDRRA